MHPTTLPQKSVHAKFEKTFAGRAVWLDVFLWNYFQTVSCLLCYSPKPRNKVRILRWLPLVFLFARALISKISRWRKLSNSRPKSRAGSRGKMPTNMTSKLLKFVYRKYCVDRLRFQNICRLNRRPQLSLLGVKEKYTSMQEFQPMKLISYDLFDRHDHRAGQSKMVYFFSSIWAGRIPKSSNLIG